MSIQEIQDTISNAADTFTQVASNFMSAGMVEYKQSTGSVKKGVNAKVIDEGVGEVTGRNAYREANADARENFRKAEESQKKLIDDERQRRFRSEKSASNYADSVRSRAESRARKSLGMDSFDKLGV